MHGDKAIATRQGAVTRQDWQFDDQFQNRVRDLLKATQPALKEHQYATFLEVCRVQHLNPFLREIYGIPTFNKDRKEYDLHTVTAYDVYVQRAMESGLVEWWKTELVKDETLDGRPDTKAIFRLKRKDWPTVFEHAVWLSEYAMDNRFWREKRRTMITKTVTGQGFRLGIPEVCGKLPYLSEEIGAVEAKMDNAPKLTQSDELAIPPPALDPNIVDFSRPEPKAAMSRIATPTKEAAEDLKSKGIEPSPADTAADPDPEPEAAPQEEPAADDGEQPTLALHLAPNGSRLLDKAVGLFADYPPEHVDLFFVAKKYLPEGKHLADMDAASLQKIVDNGEQCVRLYKAWARAHPFTKDGDNGERTSPTA